MTGARKPWSLTTSARAARDAPVATRERLAAKDTP